MGFGASVNPSVFHLPSSQMYHVIPQWEVPRKYCAAFKLSTFSPHTNHKVNENGLFEQCIPICREMKEKYYYKGIDIIMWAARILFYEPRVKIKSPKKPQNWKTPVGILGHVTHGRNFSCFILTPIINNMYIIQMQNIMGFQKLISVPIAIIPKEILFVKISRYGDVFGGI